MEQEAIGKSESMLRRLVNNFRSVDGAVRKQTITRIPNLVLESFVQKNEILDQLLLLMYNLETDSDNFESLNASNRTLVLRHLLRLYIETVDDHQHSQIDALKKTIDQVNSSELLVELAHTLHRCSSNKLSKIDKELIEEGLENIREKATNYLYPEALLMIHSILEMK